MSWCGWGWSGVLGSCDHGLLFMFTVISWGICLIRVLVWCVVVSRLLDVFVVKRGVWVWDDSLCKI